MQHLLDLFKQYWPLLLSGYVANTIASYLVRIPKSNNAFWVVVKFIHGVLNQVDPDTAKSATKVTAVSMLALMLMGCGGSIHSQIEKALVFEQQVHTYQNQLQGVAEAAIAMLPPEKQPAARATLMDATAKLTLALDAKDAALQAALDASDTANLNVNQLVADIVAAVNAVVTVINSFGADRNQTEFIGRSLVAAQVRATK